MHTSIRTILVSTFCFLIFLYGLIVGKYEIFPYELMKYARNVIAPSDNSSTPKSIERLELFRKFDSKADLAFVGDSLTAGGLWNEWFPNYLTINRGIGGDRTSDVTARLDNIVSAHPRRIFLMIGINDIHQYVSVSEILRNYGSIVDSLKAESLGVVIQSTIQCELRECGNRHVNSINTLNEGLSKLAAEKNVPFLFLGELSSKDGLNAIYTTDGVHLSALGYLYWKDKIRAHIDEI